MIATVLSSLNTSPLFILVESVSRRLCLTTTANWWKLLELSMAGAAVNVTRHFLGLLQDRTAITQGTV